jgi:NAD(P)-dependent dehydrogenase (short-subunit alcohol dehydrogenase family)
MGASPHDPPPTMALENPVPRWGHPADVEGITAYLMSDSSSYHTGDVIVVDGGMAVNGRP